MHSHGSLCLESQAPVMHELLPYEPSNPVTHSASPKWPGLRPNTCTLTGKINKSDTTDVPERGTSLFKKSIYSCPFSASSFSPISWHVGQNLPNPPRSLMPPKVPPPPQPDPVTLDQIYAAIVSADSDTESRAYHTVALNTVAFHPTVKRFFFEHQPEDGVEGETLEAVRAENRIRREALVKSVAFLLSIRTSAVARECRWETISLLGELCRMDQDPKATSTAKIEEANLNAYAKANLELLATLPWFRATLTSIVPESCADGADAAGSSRETMRRKLHERSHQNTTTPNAADSDWEESDEDVKIAIMDVLRALPTLKIDSDKNALPEVHWSDENLKQAHDLMFLDASTSLTHLIPAVSRCRQNTCAKCQKVAAESESFLRCSACKAVFYCSPACQKAHWGTTHRSPCLAFKELSTSILNQYYALNAKKKKRDAKKGEIAILEVPLEPALFFETRRFLYDHRDAAFASVDFSDYFFKYTSSDNISYIESHTPYRKGVSRVLSMRVTTDYLPFVQPFFSFSSIKHLDSYSLFLPKLCLDGLQRKLRTDAASAPFPAIRHQKVLECPRPPMPYDGDTEEEASSRSAQYMPAPLPCSKKSISPPFLPFQYYFPCFSFSNQHPCELWLPYAEKAFSKVYGSYNAIVSQSSIGALSSMTGYPYGDSNALISKLQEWMGKSHPVTISSCTTGDTEKQNKMHRMNLSEKHCHNLLAVVSIGKQRLLNIWNPHGKKTWTGDPGAWSYDSPLWRPLPDVKQVCEPEKCRRGEFWMNASIAPPVRSTTFILRVLHVNNGLYGCCHCNVARRQPVDYSADKGGARFNNGSEKRYVDASEIAVGLQILTRSTSSSRIVTLMAFISSVGYYQKKSIPPLGECGVQLTRIWSHFCHHPVKHVERYAGCWLLKSKTKRGGEVRESRVPADRSMEACSNKLLDGSDLLNEGWAPSNYCLMADNSFVLYYLSISLSLVSAPLNFSLMALCFQEITRERDHALVQVFSQCRNQVVAVASSPFLPSVVGITVQKGFVELIDAATGQFRLFLTHVGRTPLDTDLRCFSLAPCLNAAVAGWRRLHHLPDVSDWARCVLYTLSYSNELLVGFVDTGAVSVLAALASRPSALLADGDYIVCGEGTGRVTAWRLKEPRPRPGSGSADGPQAEDLATCLWSSPLLVADSVRCLTRRRHHLFCCGADLSCCVADIATGAALGRLVQEPTIAMVTLQPLDAADQRGAMLAAYPHEIVLYREREPAYRHAEVELVGMRVLPAVPGAITYSEVGRHSLTTPLSCLTTSGPFAAAGSESGTVLLFACRPDFGATEEVVRFDVGHRVAAIQLYADGLTDTSLLVVTGAGDVWRWPLADLLPPPTPPPPSAAVPGPTASSGCTGASDCTQEEVNAQVEDADVPSRHPSEPESGSAHTEIEMNAVNVILEATPPSPRGWTPQPEKEVRRGISGLRCGRRMDPRVVDAVLDNAAAQEAVGEDLDLIVEELPPLPLAGPSRNGAALASAAAATDTVEEYDEAAFAAAHPLLVDALAFAFPVAAQQYKRGEEVFGGVPVSVAGKCVGGQLPQRLRSGAGDAALAASDSLRDTTQGLLRRYQDPKLLEERRRGGPPVALGTGCQALLTPAVGDDDVVLFKEGELQATAPAPPIAGAAATFHISRLLAVSVRYDAGATVKEHQLPLAAQPFFTRLPAASLLE
eukprot:gene8454-5931_t